MRVLATQHRIVYLVEFDAKEAGEMRAIGQLPPRFEPAPAQLWLTLEEIRATSDLPLPSAMRDEIAYMATRLEATPR